MNAAPLGQTSLLGCFVILTICGLALVATNILTRHRHD